MICWKEDFAMTNAELIAKIEELKEMEELLEEAQKEVEALKDEIKSVMMEQNTEELEIGKYIVSIWSADKFIYRNAHFFSVESSQNITKVTCWNNNVKAVL